MSLVALRRELRSLAHELCGEELVVAALVLGIAGVTLQRIGWWMVKP